MILADFCRYCFILYFMNQKVTVFEYASMVILFFIVHFPSRVPVAVLQNRFSQVSKKLLDTIAKHAEKETSLLKSVGIFPQHVHVFFSTFHHCCGQNVSDVDLFSFFSYFCVLQVLCECNLLPSGLRPLLSTSTAVCLHLSFIKSQR